MHDYQLLLCDLSIRQLKRCAIHRLYISLNLEDTLKPTEGKG
jgi:hypothetical protein